jgi:hypothetical protein
MKIAKAIALMGLLAMTGILVYGFAVGDFGADGKLILANPWGLVSLVDLYVGFSLFSGWIIYREESPLVTIIWVVMMMVLGFFTASLYTFIALQKSKGDWRLFWLGKNSENLASDA